jgi:hypothetical protein
MSIINYALSVTLIESKRIIKNFQQWVSVLPPGTYFNRYYSKCDKYCDCVGVLFEHFQSLKEMRFLSFLHLIIY